MTDSSTTMVRLNEMKYQQDHLHLDFIKLEQRYLLAKLSILETRLESGSLRYDAQQRHLMDLESRQNSIEQASFHERIQQWSRVQEVQLAAEKQHMSNQKLQEEIDEAQMKLMEYAMEIGEIVDRMEDEQAEYVSSSQWFDRLRAREDDGCEVRECRSGIFQIFF